MHLLSFLIWNSLVLTVAISGRYLAKHVGALGLIPSTANWFSIYGSQWTDTFPHVQSPTEGDEHRLLVISVKTSYSIKLANSLLIETSNNVHILKDNLKVKNVHFMTAVTCISQVFLIFSHRLTFVIFQTTALIMLCGEQRKVTISSL